MKFMFMTDTHIRGTNPRNRLDDFYETLAAKMNEAVDIADEYGVDIVLHGGDWFDRPDASPAIVRDFAVIIKRFNRPIYTVAGNHDIYGHNPQTISRTMFGLLEGLDIIKLLDYNQKVFIEKDGIRVQLTGSSYNTEIDGEDSRRCYVVKKEAGVDYAVNIVHGMLLDKPFIEGLRYTLIDDLADTEADITLAGHYHSGFGIVRRGTKYFVNPGSLARITASKAEIERMPEVAIVDIGKNGIEVFPVMLKCALKGDEVLDRSAIEDAQERNLKLYGFFQQISANDEFRKVDIQSILQQIASSENVKAEVKNETIRRIEIARQNLFNGEEE